MIKKQKKKHNNRIGKRKQTNKLRGNGDFQ